MSDLDPATRMSVYERGRTCQRCAGESGIRYYSIHHRQRRGVGPNPHVAQNVILLCGSGTTGDHGWVHGNPEQARDEGYIVSAYTPADEIASQRVWSATWDRWVLLNPDWTITLVEGERPWPVTPDLESPFFS
jgi:hypothetical protein